MSAGRADITVSMRLWQSGRDRRCGIRALWMTPSTGAAAAGLAVPDGLAVSTGYVIDNVVGPCGVTTHAGGDEVQTQRLSCFPCDVMVGAGGIAAYTYRANQSSGRIVKRESAAEHVNATNVVTDHRICCGAVLGRISG